MGCPVCLLQVGVCASGLVKSHKHQGSECDGSGHRPRNLATKLPLPSLVDIEKFSILTRKDVPVSCRNLWARVVSSTYAKVKNNPSVTDNWIELFILSQCVLRSPPRGGFKHLRYEENNVESKLNRWLNGEATQLWFEATSSVKPLVIKPLPSGEFDVKRARQLGHEGSYRKAIAAHCPERLCFDDAALSVLQEKHPPAVTAVLSPEPPPDLIPCSISRDILINCVKSFPKDSAAGVSKFYATHLSNAFLCLSPAYGDQAISAVLDVVNLLARGEAPTSIAPYLCGAILLALKKKDGGIRPIAVGEILRRLVAKCLCRLSSQKAASLLVPLQVGVGVPGGCEAVSHALNGLVATVSDTTSLAILQVDLKNAFNTLDRSSILWQVADQFPELLQSCYSQPSWLKFGNFIVLSACGVQQGDILAPLLFALTIHPIIVALKNQFPDLACNVWYLDDGSFIGDVYLLAQVFPHLVSSMAKVGLEVSVEKCEAWYPIPNLVFSALPNAITVRSSGLKNLGAAISTNDDLI